MRSLRAISVVYLLGFLCLISSASTQEFSLDETEVQGPQSRFMQCYFCQGVIIKDSNMSTCSEQDPMMHRHEICSGYCFIRSMVPVNGNGAIFIRRGCSDFLMNSCMTAPHKDGDMYRICHKSCTEDLCNMIDDFEPTSGGLRHIAITWMTVCISLAVGRHHL